MYLFSEIQLQEVILCFIFYLQTDSLSLLRDFLLYFALPLLVHVSTGELPSVVPHCTEQCLDKFNFLKKIKSGENSHKINS